MNRNRQRGFTLLEMIIVLVILGLMLGLVVTRGPLHSARLDGEATARDLAGTLRLARGRAISRDQSVSVILTPSTYQIEGLPQRAIPRDVALAGNAVIRFSPDGSSSGGTVFVQTPTARTAIVVSWLTGSVNVAPSQ
jgi:general secretion pathway protein H